MEQISTSGKRSAVLAKTFLAWLPLAFGISVLTALIYGAVQQVYRQQANDPQIAMAEDVALEVQSGQQPQALVGTAKVEMSRSLAPFLIIYDANGQTLASSAQLYGSTPDLPTGVFDSVRSSGEDRLTWQPAEGVRIAAVVTQFGGSHPGFVLAGRSLREAEARTSQLNLMTFLAWVIALVGSLILTAFTVFLSARR